MGLRLRLVFEPPVAEDETVPIKDEDVGFAAAQSLYEFGPIGALTIVASVLGHDMEASESLEVADIFGSWKTRVETSLRSAYVCEFCMVSSLKELWGAGRITCPHCGKMAKSADGTDRNL